MQLRRIVRAARPVELEFLRVEVEPERVRAGHLVPETHRERRAVAESTEIDLIRSEGDRRLRDLVSEPDGAAERDRAILLGVRQTRRTDREHDAREREDRASSATHADGTGGTRWRGGAVRP